MQTPMREQIGLKTAWRTRRDAAGRLEVYLPATWGRKAVAGDEGEPLAEPGDWKGGQWIPLPPGAPPVGRLVACEPLHLKAIRAERVGPRLFLTVQVSTPPRDGSLAISLTGSGGQLLTMWTEQIPVGSTQTKLIREVTEGAYGPLRVKVVLLEGDRIADNARIDLPAVSE
jgi:hypothetical protein